MKAKKAFRILVLILALLTSPFACVGAGSLLMGLTDADVGFFNASVKVENQTNEVLYLTPITTTYAEPRVIPQMRYWRFKALRLQPEKTVRLSFDAADSPLAGVVLCNESGDCRFLEHSWEDVQIVSNLDDLPPVDEMWTAVIDAAPAYNLQVLIMTGFALAPFALLALWWRLGKREEAEG